MYVFKVTRRMLHIDVKYSFVQELFSQYKEAHFVYRTIYLSKYLYNLHKFKYHSRKLCVANYQKWKLFTYKWRAVTVTQFPFV